MSVVRTAGLMYIWVSLKSKDKVNCSFYEQVGKGIRELLKVYKDKEKISFEDIFDFHQRFELIRPFQDGNGRVGRLFISKECLNHGIVPFIITDELKMFYYRGLHEWKNLPGHRVKGYF